MSSSGSGYAHPPPPLLSFQTFHTNVSLHPHNAGPRSSGGSHLPTSVLGSHKCVHAHFISGPRSSDGSHLPTSLGHTCKCVHPPSISGPRSSGGSLWPTSWSTTVAQPWASSSLASSTTSAWPSPCCRCSCCRSCCSPASSSTATPYLHTSGGSRQVYVVPDRRKGVQLCDDGIGFQRSPCTPPPPPSTYTPSYPKLPSPSSAGLSLRVSPIFLLSRMLCCPR